MENEKECLCKNGIRGKNCFDYHPQKDRKMNDEKEVQELEIFIAEIHDLGMRDEAKTTSEEDSEYEYKKWVDYIKENRTAHGKAMFEKGREDRDKLRNALIAIDNYWFLIHREPEKNSLTALLKVWEQAKQALEETRSENS